MNSSELLEQLSQQDTVTIKNGTYRDFNCKINCNNKIIRSEPKVYFKGNSYFEVTGSNITFDGFRFKNCSVKNNFKILGSNNKILNCHFYDYSDKFEHLILLQGKYHQIKNCEFYNINHKGLCIFLYRPDDQANYILIENNVFKNRNKVPNENNELEIIRIGTSHKSQSSSNSMIINNLFESCDGEIETISIKSCGNIVGNNSLINCCGSITLRHGNHNIVSLNLIDQKNKEDSAGIRISGDSHLISNNLIKNVKGSGNRGSICLIAGQNSPKLNGYWNVKNTKISNNYIIDCTEGFAIGVKVKSDCVKKPERISIVNNVIALDSGKVFNSRSLYNDIPVYSGNDLYCEDLGNISKIRGLNKRKYEEFKFDSEKNYGVNGSLEEEYLKLKNYYS